MINILAFPTWLFNWSAFLDFQFWRLNYSSKWPHLKSNLCSFCEHDKTCIFSFLNLVQHLQNLLKCSLAFGIINVKYRGNYILRRAIDEISNMIRKKRKKSGRRRSISNPTNTTLSACCRICFSIAEILLLIGLSVESGHLKNWNMPRASCLVIREGLFSAAGVFSLTTVFLAAGLYLTALRAERISQELEKARREIVERSILYASPPRSPPHPMATIARENHTQPPLLFVLPQAFSKHSNAAVWRKWKYRLCVPLAKLKAQVTSPPFYLSIYIYIYMYFIFTKLF